MNVRLMPMERWKKIALVPTRSLTLILTKMADTILTELEGSVSKQYIHSES